MISKESYRVEIMEFTIRNGDFKLFCRKEGEGALILLIHGVACDSDYFDEAVFFLKKHYTVVSYDRRGYSRSRQIAAPDLLAGGYSVRSQMEDAAKIIRYMDSGAAFVVGCSAGGIIAVELAGKYPELVRGIILQEPPLTWSLQSKNDISKWRTELKDAVEKKHINSALISLNRAMGGTDNRSKSISLESQMQNLENLKVFLLEEIDHFLEYEIRKEEITLPCAVMVGECDKEGLFARTAESIAAHMNWRLVRTPGFHNFPADLPFEFAVMIAGLISEMQYWRSI